MKHSVFVSRVRNAAALLVCWSLQVAADHPGIAFGNDASGPIITIAASALPAGTFAIGLRHEYIDSEALSDTRLSALAAAGVEGVHSVDTLNSASLGLAYGLSDTLSISVRLPWVAREAIREGEFEDGAGEVHSHGDVSGLGDLVALASWRAWRFQRLDLAFQAGFKAPSGQTHETDRGTRLETEFQPGSGAWDALAGAAASIAFDRFSVHGNVLGSITAEGAQGFERGNAVSYNLALVYPLGVHDLHDEHAPTRAHRHWRFDAVLEVNGETRGHDQIDGVEQTHSGGSVVYLSPGLRAAFGKYGAFVSAGLPLAEHTHGIQTDVSLRLTGGLSLTF